MSPEQFAYWLRGFFEISGATKLTAEQVKVVKEHLEKVFVPVKKVENLTGLWWNGFFPEEQKICNLNPPVAPDHGLVTYMDHCPSC